MSQKQQSMQNANEDPKQRLNICN